MGEVIAQVLSKEGFDVWRWSPMGAIELNPKNKDRLGFYLKFLYPRDNQTLILGEYRSETYFTIDPEKSIKKLNRFFGKKLTNLKVYLYSENLPSAQ